MTKQEHDEALRKILEATPMTEDMVELVEKLRQDFDESEGAKIADKEGDWRSKYEDLRKRYMDRFFEPPAPDTSKIEEERHEIMPVDIVKEMNKNGN